MLEGRAGMLALRRQPRAPSQSDRCFCPTPTCAPSPLRKDVPVTSGRFVVVHKSAFWPQPLTCTPDDDACPRKSVM